MEGKLLTLVFKILSDLAPTQLSGCIFPYKTPLGSTPSLRLQSQRMASPQIHHLPLGLCFALPAPWNLLHYRWVPALCLPSGILLHYLWVHKSLLFFKVQLQCYLLGEVLP